jgi:hypothetical protein
LIAFVLSYLYPVIIGGADALRYFEASLYGNWDSWRLVLAVFLVACAITTVVFTVLAACVFVPLLLIFPRLADASVQTFFLLGLGLSLLVLVISWLVHVSSGMLTGGDYSFMRLAVIIDGPTAMVSFWCAGRQMRNRHSPAA